MPAKKKKKGRAHRATVSNPETAEELLALAAIYGDEFSKHQDGLGFDLAVVPHPGMLDENLVCVQLSVRYPHHYPAQPVALKLKNPEGLSVEEGHDLLTRLTKSAAEHAEAEEVCAFNLVDMCQELLRAANERRQKGVEQVEPQQGPGAKRQGAATASGDQAHSQSLWHSMQRRNGGVGVEDDHRLGVERQGSLRGSLAGAEASVLSLGEDLPSLGQVGGLSGGLWGYDDGLYDMDDSVNMDAGLFGPPSPPALQSPTRRTTAAAIGMDHPKPGSPDLQAAGEVLAIGTQPAKTTGSATATATAASPQPGTDTVAGPGVAFGAAQLNGTPGTTATTTPVPDNGGATAKLQAVLKPKGRAGGLTRPSPFDRQARPSRVPAAVLARRLPRAMRALVSGASSASIHSFEERSRHCLNRSHTNGAGKVAAAGSHTRRCQHAHGSSSGSSGTDGRDGRTTSSGSSSSSGRDSPRRPKGSLADAGGGDAAKKRLQPGRLWARCGDSSGSGSSGSSEEGSEDGTENESGSSNSSEIRHHPRISGGASGASLQREVSDVRLPLLLGHLLTLAAAGSSVDSRGGGLEALCDHLRRRGLLPQWLHWLVTRQPQLFEQAFRRVFGEDMRAAAAAAAMADRTESAAGADSRALMRFWSRQAVTGLPGASGGSGSQRQHPHGGRGQGQLPLGARGWMGSGEATMAALVASRYLSDFLELRRLGKGGFGVVVAAVNRLDGRQYAVKKIKLDSGSPSSYMRITREVATLSRLQHPNVVRYFQAWCENLPAGVGLDGSEDEDDEDDEFGDYSEDDEAEEEDIEDGDVEGGEDAWGFGSSQSSDSYQLPAGQPHIWGPAHGQQQQQRQGAALGAGLAGLAARLGPPAHQLSQSHHRHGHAHQHHEPAHLRGLAPVREEAGDLTSAFGSSIGDPETGSEVSASASASVAGSAAVTAGADSGVAQRSGSADTDVTGTHAGAENDSDNLAIPPGSMGNRTSTPSRFASASVGGSTGTDGCGIGGGYYENNSETNTTETSTTTTTTTVTRTTTTAATATTITMVIGKGTRQQSGNRRQRPKGQCRKSSQTSIGGSPTQMLYIQMEFCPRTLAEVLQEGPLQEEDAWRVLRGILAGLAYIHSQGVIHRDLKPANIFYGANGEIKLGDFGLAKFHSNTSAEDVAASAGLATPSGVGGGTSAVGASGVTGTAATAAGPAAGAGGHSWRAAGGADGTAPSERTGVCGSYFYISPEIKNGWARYDEKVDLWSLGVVAFELWHPFATGMERAVLLNDLRDHARLPEAWEQEHPRVARLIRWLMAPNPGERPSAREVLASDLLPPRVEDEQLKDLLRYLPSNPDATERVVAALFSLTEGQPPGAFSVPTTSASGAPAATHWPPGAGGPARAPGSSSNLDAGGGLAPLPFDGTELPGAPRVQHAQAREDVIRAVRSVFECHGARSFFSNQVGYAYSGLAPDAVRLLSPHGAVLAMRHEMRYPFAVWLVQQLAMEQAAGSLDTLRRYDISYVMRSGRARSLPTSYCQADLDLLHPAGSGGGCHPDKGRLLAEAEAIKAVTQVLDQFIPELGRYEVRISHRAIERALYDSMGLSPAATASASAATGTSGGGAAAGSGAGGSREADLAVRRLIATALRASPMLGAVRGELRYKAWPSVKAGLDGFGLPADRVARFKRCVCELPGDIHSALARLKAYLQEASTAAAAVAASPGVGGQAKSTAEASTVWKVATTPTGHAAPATKAAGATASAAATGMPPSSQSRNAGGGSGGSGGSGGGNGPSGGGSAANPTPVSSLSSTLALAMEEVAMVVQLLDVWGVAASQVVLDPLMSPTAEYYSGVFFQVHLLGLPAAPGQQGAGSSGVSSGSIPLGLPHGALAAQRQLARSTSAGMVAVGGRYDALLRALWVTSAAATATPGQHPHAHGSLGGYAYASLPGAVGATLNVERLITGLSQQRAAMAGAAVYSMGLLRSLEASKADVLVCARGGDGALAQRMALVSALWNVGVRAEMMPRPAPSLSDQYAYAQARGVRAVVILGDRDALSGDVTIKSLDKRSESVVVPLQDAPRQLAAALSTGSSAGRGVAGAVASSVVHAVYNNYGSGVGVKEAAIAALFSAGVGQRQSGASAGAMFGGGAECKGGAHGGGRLDV
ncbi:hypothetical protein Vretimale_9508, partial [Volvox reticuliferus]